MRRILPILAAVLMTLVGMDANAVTLQGVSVRIAEADTQHSGTQVGGIVQFDAIAPLTQTTVFDDANIGWMSHNNTVAAYGDGKVFLYQWRDPNYQLTNVYYFVYSQKEDGSWICSPKKNLYADYSSFPQAMTYNPQTGVLYGFRNGAQVNGMDAQVSVIYTIDITTGAMTYKAVADTYLNSLTTTPFGVTYAADYIGNFYEVDMESGSLRKIGSGMPTSLNICQGCLDAATGNFYYYVPLTNGAQSLYQVDITNGNATKIGDFDGTYGQMRCIFSTSQMSEEQKAAPDICSELTVTPVQPGSLNVTLSAKAPVYTFDKETPLQGNVTLKFYVDNSAEAEASVENVAPGATASANYSFSAAGRHLIRVVAVNATGEGAPLTDNPWIGFDTPVAPTNLYFSIDDYGNYSAAWSAPTTGVNGGDIDVANLKYNFTLYPGGETQTLDRSSLTGKITDPAYKGYYYTVSAQTGDNKSEEATSESVGYGKAFDAPLAMDFATADNWALHTAVVKSGTAKWVQWKRFDDQPALAYCNNMYVDPFVTEVQQLVPATENADAWLLTPPINMHAGVEYTITAVAASEYDQMEGNKLSLMVGGIDDALEDYTHIYTDANIRDYTIGYTAFDYKYTADKEGTGRFAFVCGNQPGGILFLISYSVEATAAPGAPAAIENLKAEAGEKGALNATLTFDAPTTTVDGSNLSSIDCIKIYRDGLDLITTIENITPGQTGITFTDNDVRLGSHTYNIAAYNEFAGGTATTSTLWIGEDQALAPVNFKVEETDNDYILTWDAPEGGVHGAYIDYDNIAYNVMYQYEPMEMWGNYQTRITEREIMIPKSFFAQRLGERQCLLTLYVQAVTKAGEGYPTYIDQLYGGAYNLPFTESFRNSYTETEPWTTQTDEEYAGGWHSLWDGNDRRPAEVYSQDEDGGMSMFWQQSGKPLYTERLITPQVNLAGASEPTLTFWMYHIGASDYDNQLEVEVKIGNEFYGVGNAILLSDGNGWMEHVVSLKDCGGDLVRVAFKAQGKPNAYIFIDNISIEDSFSTVDKATEAYANVRGGKGMISIAADNCAYAIYTMDGRLAATGRVQGMTTVNLAPGAYIVRVANRTIKVII